MKPSKELLPARSARTAPGRVRRLLQPAALSRKPQQPNPGRCLLRSRSNHSQSEVQDQAADPPATSPAALLNCSLNLNPDGPDPLLNPLLTCPKGSDDVHRLRLSPPGCGALKRPRQVCGLDYPFTVPRTIRGLGAARLVSTPSWLGCCMRQQHVACLPGLARDCHFRFPRIWAVLHRRFPRRALKFPLSP